MNIFASNPCSTESAKFLDDKRVVKMALESAQLLATSVNLMGGTATYKTTHKDHPCSVWVRTCQGNYMWMVDHFDALCKEYTSRFGKIHLCSTYRNEFLNGFLNGLSLIPKGSLTTHPNCTIFKDEADVYKAYKMYLNYKWENDKVTPRWFKIPK